MKYNKYYNYKEDYLYQDLSKSPSIESIEIDNYMNKYIEMKHIKTLLTNNRNLRELSILKCYINQEGFKDLQDALKSNTILKRLNLYSFGSVKDSIEIIIDIISSNVNLRALSLCSCLMNDDDFSKLLTSVQDNKNLKILNLSGNKMTDKSLKLLFSNSFKFNKCLKEIILNKCNFTIEGIGSIKYKSSLLEDPLISLDYPTEIFLENGHTKIKLFY